MVKSGWVSALGIGSAANLGRFAELYEVQMLVVVMIYLDLVASTAQLLPYFQTTGGGAGNGAGAVERVTVAGAGFGAFVVRLLSRFMQVLLACLALHCSCCIFVLVLAVIMFLTILLFVCSDKGLRRRSDFARCVEGKA